MRDLIWLNLTDVQFKALYTYEISKRASKWGNVYSFILALVSTTSVTAWAVWLKYPTIWAFIIGIAQVLQIAKPYISFLNKEKDFLEMSFQFEDLYLEYEELWHKYESGKLDQDQVSEQFYLLRKKGLDIQRTHKTAHCPQYKKLMERVNEETNNVIKLNFPIQNERILLNENTSTTTTSQSESITRREERECA